MADLQIVFADNPRWAPVKDPKVAARKDLQSQEEKGKVKKKEKSRMKKKPSPAQIRARKKFAAMARARSKAAKAKHRKKKNPYRFEAQKGKRKIKTNSFGSKKEMKGIAHRLSKFKAAQGRGYLRKRSKRGRAVAKAVKQIERRVKANTRYRKAALKKARALKKKGYKVKKVYVSPRSTLAAAYKSVSKRKKRKGGKRKHSQKELKVAKRRRKKKAGAKRKTHRRKKGHAKRRSRRKGGRRVVYLSKKRKSVVIRRKNPSFAQVESYTGFKAEELGSLLIGGAVYGTVDGLAAQYAPAVYQMAAKIPVLGTTVVPAAIGVALKIAGDKFKIKPLAMVGEGIVGAAVVAMGIQASAYLPGISKSTATAGYGNVDFTPSLRGYARDGADFGNVDFTPGMGSQPQLGLEPQMGRDPGSADFGLIPEGLGLIPEGLGGLA